MYAIEIRPTCQKNIDKLCSKDPVLSKALENKIEEIRENPSRYKPLKYELKGKLDANNFIHADGSKGLMPALWAIFYDFHSLMNNEILYTQMPSYIYYKFDKMKEKDFEEIDELAKLMLEPDNNFDELIRIWNTKKKFRILNGPLVGDSDHVKWK
ncbi:MAG TPA: hypothetical protein HA362_04000 [Nanoarchaeota archaeon]|nr:hypothetical protein [Nanoarchaeota archaeon]